MSFTYKHYKETCLSYIDQGYQFCSLDIEEPFLSKLIYMVHDCDFFLEHALRLAHEEKDIGIKSTYFVRLGAREYNLFNPFYSNIVQEILSLGHDIGLHYESIFADSDVQYNIDIFLPLLMLFSNLPHPFDILVLPF